MCCVHYLAKNVVNSIFYLHVSLKETKTVLIVSEDFLVALMMNNFQLLTV